MSEGYAYAWEFTVLPGHQAEFEQHYRPGGTWARLFARSAGYIGTILLKDATASGRYVTVDRWRDEQAFLDFRSAFSLQYEQLDLECGTLTVAEQRLGVFAALGR